MHRRTKKFVLISALVLTVPTTALAAGRLFKWHSGLYQIVAPQQTAHEVHRLYQLRVLCTQSNVIQSNLALAIQKLRDHNTYWAGVNFKDDGSQINSMIDRRNSQIQNLHDRNARYLEKIFSDVTKYGPENPSIWGPVQAKHDELAQIMSSGDFQGCMAELDNLLPAQIEKGGRP